MKAIVQKAYGAPERVLELAEVNRPRVGDDDVLIRVRATSVTTPDWVTVTGVPYILPLQFGLRRPPTPVRGTDVAGVVEAVGGNVTDLQPGNEVFGSSWADTLATPSTFAEFTVAPASKLIKKPVGLTFEDAGASAMSGLTALIAVWELSSQDVRPTQCDEPRRASGQEVTHAYEFRRHPCSSNLSPGTHVARPHGRGPSCHAGLRRT